jgi:hypothetical protein
MAVAREKMEEAILTRVREIMASVVNPQELDIHIHMVSGCAPNITYNVKDDVVIEKGDK